MINPPAATPGTATAMRLSNAGIIEGVILRAVTLGVVLWIGSIRGWSLLTFGLRPSWKGTGGGVLLFFAFLVIEQILGFLTRQVFHRTVDFHRVNELT